jgi:hypothetical protein
MKNIKRSLGLLLITLLAVACTQENGALYEFPNETGQVSLASGKYTAELATEDGTTITVKVGRNMTKGALDVPFSFTSSSPIFTMSDTVAHFADGAATASLTIAYPGSEQMEIGESYELTVSLVDEEILSVGGVSKQTLTLKRRLTWVDAGTGQWTDGVIPPLFGAEVLTYDVAIEKAEEADGVYRLVDPYGYEVYEYTAEEEVVSKPCYVMINALDPNNVVIPEAGIGIDWGYGEIFIGSLAPGVREGKTITFPAEALFVGMRKYNDGLPLLYADECVLQLP